MRYISVAASGIKEQPGGAIATGEDDRNGDIVEFSMTLAMAAAVQATPGSSSLVPVPDEDIISVATAPVSGEWDSPGTSPEEYDDETF